MSRSEVSPPGPNTPSWLGDGFAAGCKRHGDFGVDFAQYREHVLAAARRRVAASAGRPNAIARVARSLALDDLYLACACELRSELAWNALRTNFAYRLTTLLRKRGVQAQEATEIVADLPGMLVADPGSSTPPGRSRLSSFDGSGSLFGWLAVIALREWQRRRARNHGVTAPDLSAVVAAKAADSVDREAGQRFAEAVRLAWGRLTPRHRTVLALRYSHGLQQVEIMRLLGVSAPRISRLLDRAVRELRTCVELLVGGSGSDLLAHWSSLREALGVELQRLHGKAQ
ncbi:MAG TPA: sigma-70 family RNA polymerase sigma factor [Planctomycetota bacterium]|nr:sigma-70 family RNA polymerase sigma factor [Planctomycetota bacterium]